MRVQEHNTEIVEADWTEVVRLTLDQIEAERLTLTAELLGDQTETVDVVVRRRHRWGAGISGWVIVSKYFGLPPVDDEAVDDNQHEPFTYERTQGAQEIEYQLMMRRSLSASGSKEVAGYAFAEGDPATDAP